jgi:hypothetical protein
MTGWEVSDVQTVPSIELAMTRVAEFAEVVCGDRDLLRAEFDAIIAANWPSHEQPTLPPPHPGSVPRSRPADPECSAVEGGVLRPTPVVPGTLPAHPRNIRECDRHSDGLPKDGDRAGDLTKVT